MNDFGFKVGGQVDDRNCVEGTLLRTDSAAYAEALGDEGNLRLWGDFNATWIVSAVVPLHILLTAFPF